MKISLAWLKELVDLPGVGELVSRFNLSGLEVSSIRPLGTKLPPELATLVSEPMPVWAPDKVVFAKILRIEKHPDADRLKLPVVDDGTGTEKALVTGAPNIAVGESGQTVILARTGSALFDGHSDTKVIKELKPTKIRGIPSDSMLCSAYELGLSEEHEGIILHPEEVKPGTPAVEVLGDTVIEVDILPNMGRCLSMLGVAREVSALFGGQVRTPEAKVFEEGSWPTEVKISIEDTKLCERYSCRLISGLKVGSSPSWMRTRLLASGMRPISNLVDVTNFVMLEQGQPLHAFDYDKLIERAAQSGAKGGAIQISVRAAQSGEKLLTLDGKERELEPGMLVIADSAGPIALAGIMGGALTEVTPETSRVLLESAHFDPIRTRKTMQALHLPSEASLRFSRGVAPTQAGPALERAAGLLAKYGEGKIAAGVIESWPVPPTKRVVKLTGAKVQQVLGMELPLELAQKHLLALGFGVKKVAPAGAEGWELEVAIPPERLDIQEGAVDLIEELARLEGYDRLPMTLLAETAARPVIKSSREFHETVKNALVELGLQEVITYSLSGIQDERHIEPGLEADGGSHIRLANPISPERAVMRRSLAASVLAVAIANLRQNGAPVQKIFEIGKIYLPGEGQNGPTELNRLAMVLGGRRREPCWDSGATAEETIDFFDLKGVLEGLLALLGHDPTQLRLDGTAVRPGLHPGRQVQVSYRHHGKERPLGWFGELHPKTAKALGWEGGKPLIAGEFDLDLLESIRPEKQKFKPVSRFPMALRDVAVVVDEAIGADQVAREIRSAAGDLLSELRLFDIYRGEGVPDGRKSLAWSLGYQAFDRTLADKEIDKAHLKVEDRLVRQLKAVIRGKEAAP